MKICFALPDAHVGGIRTFACNFGAQFARDGHDVTGLIIARGHTARHPGDIGVLLDSMNVEMCRQSLVPSRSAFIRKVAATINRIRPDVLLLNHTIWGHAALPYIDPEVRRVLVIHGFAPQHLNMPRGNADWWDAIVAVGPKLHQTLLEQWPMERTKLIPVGVTPPHVPPRATYEEKTLRLCYAGRLCQSEKNVLLIPEIAAKLLARGVDFGWTIIGDGEDRAALEDAVAQSGAGDRFSFAGACTPEATERLIADHHVLVLPSHTESIGHVLQEAAVLGVVGVASRLPGATDFVIDDGKSGILCPPGDADAFAGAIDTLYGDRAKLAALAWQARRNVLQRFDVASLAKSYYELFDSVASLKHRPRAARKAAFGRHTAPPELMPPRWQTAMNLLWGAR
jgi:glycosyltransferase involved in cell wall biosynthesis